tara:strand:- start:466 stop:714 length:249 start_codon:yes stop_codon:yes gene_type:complete
MNKVLIQTLEAILNQNHTMPFTVELVDSTDNGSFKQAEVQMAGEWVGDVDIESMMNMPFVEMAQALKIKAESFRENYEKAVV